MLKSIQHFFFLFRYLGLPTCTEKICVTISRSNPKFQFPLFRSEALKLKKPVDLNKNNK